MPRLEGSPPIMEAMAMEPWVPSGHANLTSCLSRGCRRRLTGACVVGEVIEEKAIPGR
jgi:hypothetical protein